MPPKKKNRRSGKKNRLLVPAGIILLLLASLGAAFYFVFLRTAPPSPVEIAAPAAKRAVQRERPAPLPPPKPASSSPSKTTPATALPQVAIVIDDMGMHRERGEQLLALDLDLTFSFLPYAPHTRALARTAELLGRDILMHLPMEPEDTKRWDPGPGALYLTMPEAALRMHVEKNLSLVPMAIGVNNHMGSRFTADREAMRTVLALLRPRGLFFIDSLTTPASVGCQVAAELGLPSRRRDVFLDNIQEEAAITRQLDQLIGVARQKGSAVAICHPYPATVAALAANSQRLRAAVQVVGLQQLIERERSSVQALKR